ncbi:MAG TPA: hypothetical protein VHD35_08335 [Chitinophagaceae bacterium]|jgi:hypothetical protein|nr:hypothetical protein [Chitinophagaceae bacterium]
MKKFLFAIVILGAPFYGVSQNKIDINKWRKACLNLEVRPNFFVSKIWCRIQTLERRGVKIDPIKVNALKKQYNSTIISWTGLFLKYKHKHYLLTARHCLVDDSAAVKNFVFEKIYLVEDGSNKINITDHSIDQKTPYVPYLDGYVYGKNVQYSLSDSSVDLGIIALDDIPGFGKQFVDGLYSKGYIPIDFSDIDTTHRLLKNQEITLIGFPSELSQLKNLRKNVDSSIYYWRSTNVTIPDVSTGYIKDPMNKNFFFRGNVFSYHGFSGGPVISNNKLIGINKLYGGVYMNTKSPQLNYYTDEFAEFTKAYKIIPLLKDLEKRFPKSAAETAKIKLTSLPLSLVLTGGTCN